MIKRSFLYQLCMLLDQNILKVVDSLVSATTK